MLAKLFKQILQKKLVAGIILALIITGVYFGYKGLTKDNGAMRYVTVAVGKDTLVVSVSGSGQVSTSDQIDIKPKVSGDVAGIRVKEGQKVKKGDLLVILDDSEAKKDIREAETDLETTKLSLEDAYQDALDSKEEAEEDLEQAYEDAFNEISNAFSDFSMYIDNLYDILNSFEIAKGETGILDFYQNYGIFLHTIDHRFRPDMKEMIDEASSDYKIAEEKCNVSNNNYKDTSRYFERDIIDPLLESTLETAKAINEAAKELSEVLDYWVNCRLEESLSIFSTITNYQSDLDSFILKTNSYIPDLLSIERGIKNAQKDKKEAEKKIEEVENKGIPQESTIWDKKTAVREKEDALADAKQSLEDYYLRAPFDGIIADINIKKGESISSNTILVSLITKQKIAEIFLNEVDVAKVKVGQKATIVLDALSELSISGEVVEIDVVGAVTQGVVSYGVRIAFDTEEEQIKPGMSATADIITDVRQDVLVLPNSAIKSKGDFYYVEFVEADEQFKQQLSAKVSGIILPESPQTQAVEVGLSNDLFTEIISGLKEGDIVVSSIIGQNEAQTTETQGFKMPMMGGRK